MTSQAEGPNGKISERLASYYFHTSVRTEKTSWLWDDDIPVAVSPNHEKNPSITAFSGYQNSPEMFLAAEEWEGTDTPGKVIIRKSSDHGQTWPADSSLYIGSSQSPLSHPVIAQISDSSLGVVLTEDRQGSDHDILFAKFNRDLSNTNITAIDLSPNDQVYPSITCDYNYYPDNPYIYLVCYQLEGASAKIIFKRSTNGGKSWSSQEMGTLYTPGILHCSISYANDNLVIAFSFNTGDDDNIAVLSSSDRGSSWNNLALIAFSGQEERNPEAAVINENTIFVFYEYYYRETDRDIYYAYSENAGKSWHIGNALAYSDGDERYPQVKGLHGSPDVFAAFLNLTDNSVLTSKTLYVAPTSWSEPSKINNSQNSLSQDDPPALLPKYTPAGLRGLGIAWCSLMSDNTDIYFNASWLPMDLELSGYIISADGTPLESVIMEGLPGSPETDQNGFYQGVIHAEWSGLVKPVKAGWQFSPASRSYTNISSNQNDQNYSGSVVQYSISGYVQTSTGNPISGITVSGLPGSPVTDAAGYYVASVPHGWSGTATPTGAGWQFSPVSRTYSNITSNQISQNYAGSVIQYSISGTVLELNQVPCPGVAMNGLPGNPVTDAQGIYSAMVPFDWSGIVTPSREGWLFSPDSLTYKQVRENHTGQNYLASMVQYRISGYIRDSESNPINEVVLVGLPGNPSTDSRGFYSSDVPQGWSGTVIPGRTGWQFSPESRTYTDLKSDQADQNYTGSLNQYSISGAVLELNQNPRPGVAMNGLPGNPVTDNEGAYFAIVPFDWSGTVTPSQEGWFFSPASLSYSQIRENRAGQDYIASAVIYAISGYIRDSDDNPLSEIVLNGLPGNPSTDSQGFYSASVPQGWTGTVTPSGTGWKFSPESRSYTNVAADQTSQDYTGSIIRLTISGYVGESEKTPLPDVILTGLPDESVTDEAGSYSALVPYNWSGTITPLLAGWTFDPTSITYQQVTGDQSGQDYMASSIHFTISGHILDADQNPIEGVTLLGPDLGSITDEDGYYESNVAYNWSGSITPQKAGWEFSPLSRTYLSVGSHQSEQNYAAAPTNSVTDQNNLMPARYVLFQNYPNPFNPSTRIKYAVPHHSHITLIIYNLVGEEICRLADSFQAPGYYSIEWKTENLASGTYFCRIQADGFRGIIKMLLLR
ncbi:MAG: hypothetical protein P8184_01365 [Calditrichia bacterium]